MGKSIFLSASLPDARFSRRYAATADPVAITSAINALVHVVIGRRQLVWGGHPAITPLIATFADAVGVKYDDWVTLYQSRFFENEFVAEVSNFTNVVYVAAESDKESSLVAMRQRMILDHDYEAAVFIGGMEGVIDEATIFQQFKRETKIVPLASTGGAALQLYKEMKIPRTNLLSLRFISLLYEELGVSPQERRYELLRMQPTEKSQRTWTHKGVDRTRD